MAIDTETAQGALSIMNEYGLAVVTAFLGFVAGVGLERYRFKLDIDRHRATSKHEELSKVVNELLERIARLHDNLRVLYHSELTEDDIDKAAEERAQLKVYYESKIQLRDIYIELSDLHSAFGSALHALYAEMEMIAGDLPPDFGRPRPHAHHLIEEEIPELIDKIKAELKQMLE